jgi:hypothetical protein
VFNYGETKKLKAEQGRIEGRIDQLTATALDQNKRLREIEQTYASAETLRWAVAEITKLEKRLKTLETSTQPPAGLEPIKHGGPRFKGQRVPGGWRDHILAALAQAGRPMTAGEIGRAIGAKSSHRERLRRMDAEGLVVRMAYGLYALPREACSVRGVPIEIASSYGGHTSRYVEAATLKPARSVGQANGRG